MTADEIKAALRRRHPGERIQGMVNRWTCIEEWAGIDLLALDSWAPADVIGYEIKTSRSDMRSELLRPWKRARAVSLTTKFYFAVPAGMLTAGEKFFREPEWTEKDFEREPCPWPCRKKTGKKNYWRGRGDKSHLKGMLRVPVPVVLAGRDSFRYGQAGWTWAKCPYCGGRGYVGKSVVEKTAPTLWVPNDVGLVEVDGTSCRVTQRAPKREKPIGLLDFDESFVERRGSDVAARIQRQRINNLVRWVSNRPDPRHSRRLDEQH